MAVGNERLSSQIETRKDTSNIFAPPLELLGHDVAAHVDLHRVYATYSVHVTQCTMSPTVATTEL